MESELIATRSFNHSDQLLFAELTGDRNPMHVDAVFARRTQAGAPAVHGMHLLLWAVDALARSKGGLPQVRNFKARFSNFVVTGDQAELRLLECSSRCATLRIAVGGVTASRISLLFGGMAAAPASASAPESVGIPEIARDLPFEDMQSSCGTLSFATQTARLAALFPAASAWLGAGRIGAIGASSTIVGMICPGLHSIYGSLSADFVDDATAPQHVVFRVASSDPRFRLLRLAIAGGGIAGTIECMARIPPVAQETMQSLADSVSPAEFQGSTALIVGGSRGLGELVAKLIARGGGKVLITHRVGRSDADKVMQEINAAGGDCTSLEYDVLQPAAPQLAGLASMPTHLYYFATPVIYRQQADDFSPQRFRQFLDFYVDGFWDLFRFLHGHNGELSAFYPSTVFVTDTPRGMTEYAMAKGAGELLCARLNDALGPARILVSRLPRMATDQTASNLPVGNQSGLSTLLPLVRQVQAPRG